MWLFDVLFVYKKLFLSNLMTRRLSNEIFQLIGKIKEKKREGKTEKSKIKNFKYKYRDVSPESKLINLQDGNEFLIILCFDRREVRKDAARIILCRN